MTCANLLSRPGSPQGSTSAEEAPRNGYLPKPAKSLLPSTRLLGTGPSLLPSTCRAAAETGQHQEGSNPTRWIREQMMPARIEKGNQFHRSIKIQIQEVVILTRAANQRAQARKIPTNRWSAAATLRCLKASLAVKPPPLALLSRPPQESTTRSSPLTAAKFKTTNGWTVTTRH